MNSYPLYSEDSVATFAERSRSISLTKKEKLIFDYIKDNGQRIIHMSIAEVAEACQTSEASLVRFSKKLGYKGFQALKIHVAQELVSPALQFHESITPDDTVSTITQKVFHSYCDALNATLSILDFHSLELAAQKIAKARRVIFFAVGASGNIAEDITNKLMRIGILAHYYSDINMQRMAAAALSENDVAIGISHTGATISTIELLATAKQNHATTIILTSFNRSPIVQYGDIRLITSARETYYKGEPTASRVAQITVLDSIVALIANGDSEYYYGNLQKTRGALDSTKI